MAERRKTDGEATRTVFRSNRLVQEGGKWYFHTREGTLEGPFLDSIEASRRLHNYIISQGVGSTPVIELDLVPLASA